MMEDANSATKDGKKDEKETETTTTNKNNMTANATPITLPSVNHKLLCWKVRNGSSVRKGETIAIATTSDTAEASNNAINNDKVAADDKTATASSNKPQYKRPKKRRRPGAPAAVNSNSTPSTDTAAAASSQVVNDSPPTNDNAPSTSNNSKPKLPQSIITAAATTDNSNKPSGQSTVTTAKHKQNEIPIIAPVDGILRIGGGGSSANSNSNSSMIIGTIEECSHPAVVDGLCVVCGTSIKQQKDDNDEKNSKGISYFDEIVSTDNANTADKKNQMSQVTSGGVTVRISESEGLRMAQQDNERLRKQRKLSLVLDLDHTLVHATNDIRAQEHVTSHSDVRSLLLPVVLIEQQSSQGGQQQQQQQQPRTIIQQHYVKLRPHVREFLQALQDKYELVVYTAGTREYAEHIVLTLARHVVGADRDPVHIDQLRRKISKLQYELNNKQKEQLQQQQQNDADNNTPNSNGTKSSSSVNEKNDNGRASDGVEATKLSTTEGNLDESGPAKKRLRTDESGAAVDVSSTNNEPEDGVSDKVAGDKKEEQEGSNNTKSAAKAKDDGDNGQQEENKKKKRKRRVVTFGEPPSTAKSDHATQEMLNELQHELDTAFELESQAVKLRQKLFGSRVHSRTELGDLGRDVKSLKRIFPCGGTMAAVVDDREDVWANASDNSTTTNKMSRKGEPPENLLLVRPYHWDTFMGYADVNNAAGASLPEGEKKTSIVSSELDQQLLWTKDILLRLHKKFYNYDGSGSPDVPGILQKMRRTVLKGCTLVLSGLVPLHIQDTADSNKPRPAAIRYAGGLGATIVPAVTNAVTHVVGAKDGTDKILAARKVPGCFVVKPSWLMECVWTITRRDENPHLLGLAPVKPPPALSESRGALQPIVDGQRDSNPSSSSSDEDDDDLVAEFENELMEQAD